MSRKLPMLLLLTLLLALFFAACGDKSDSSDDDATPDTDDDSAIDDDQTDDDSIFVDDDSDDDDTIDDDVPPEIEWKHCLRFFDPDIWFWMPKETQCGSVIAPWDREDPEGQTYEVRFAYLPAASKKSAGTLAIHLGGPDPNMRNAMILGVTPEGILNRELHETFDLLFVEVRGSSTSSVKLVCPEEIAERQYDSPDEFRALVKLCLAAQDQAYNPAYMSTLDSVEDLDLVRRALGIEQLRLYGNSYGGGFMLNYVRLFGEHVLWYLLDSPLAPSMPGLHDFDRSLKTIAADCAADPDCPFDGDQLLSATENLFEQLDDAPLPLGLNGQMVTEDLFHIADYPNLLKRWPTILASAETNNLTPLRAWHLEVQPFMAKRTDLPSETHKFSEYDLYSDNTMCIDFPHWNIIDEDAFVMRRLSPPYVPFEQLTWMCEISCEEINSVWEKTPAHDASPVTTDLPGLVFTPRFDEDTPWQDIDQAVADGLSQATLVPVNADHAVLLRLGADRLGWRETDEQCLRELVRDWLVQPFDPYSRECVNDLASRLDF